MISRRSSESAIREFLSGLEKEELQLIAEDINLGVDDEDEIDLDVSKSKLITQILEFKNSHVFDSIEACGLLEEVDNDTDWNDEDDVSDDEEYAEDIDIEEAYQSEFIDVEKEFKFNEREADKRLDHFQKVCITELEAAFLSRRRHRQYLYVATGGGKTLIAADFIHKHFLRSSKRVLWLTHQPYLLYQAARVIIQRHGRDYDLGEDFGYFGSEGDQGRHLYRRVLKSWRNNYWGPSGRPKLLLSTWQALGNDNNLDSQGTFGRLLRTFDPSLIVVDEAHWGKGGALERKIYERLFNRTWSDVPILGLSATPKVRMASYAKWNREHIGNVFFASLVGTRLAMPEEICVELNTKLDLDFDRYNRVKTENLHKNDQRNREIVATYKREKFRLGKTLVVAASIKHANALHAEFERSNESAVAIHTGVQNPTGKLKQFIDRKYLIGIVVGMAREGVDIPDLKSVMLAKPITSEVEFAQIVGRASRREFFDHKGQRREKEVFYIVDFYDTLKNPEHQKLLYHFKNYFKGVGDKEVLEDQSVSHYPRAPRIWYKETAELEARSKHEYSKKPIFKMLRFNDNCDVDCLALNHLRINTHQTFGIEFELAPKDGGPNYNSQKEWQPVAKELESLIKAVFPQKGVFGETVFNKNEVKNIDHGKWNIVRDTSCGWEIVTPILRGEGGFIAIAKFLGRLNGSGILDKLGLEVNATTGTHVNLGWNFKEPGTVQRLLKFMRLYEPALFTLVPPSRVVGPNEYCAPIRTLFSDSEISDLGTKREISSVFRDYDKRYHTVNLTKYDDPVQVLEVRMHGGTVNAQKILLWTSLWMNILAHIQSPEFKVLKSGESKRTQLPTASESSDILYILHDVLGLSANEEVPYLELFDRRRGDVFVRNDNWKDALDQHKSIVQFFKKQSAKYIDRS